MFVFVWIHEALHLNIHKCLTCSSHKYKYKVQMSYIHTPGCAALSFVVLWLKHDDVIKWKHFPRYWNLPVTSEFPAQRPVTRSFDIFFDLRLNKRLSKQSWGWWFETQSCSLYRHCNVKLLRVTCYLFTYVPPYFFTGSGGNRKITLPSTSEVSLKDMDKVDRYQTVTKHYHFYPRAYTILCFYHNGCYGRYATLLPSPRGKGHKSRATRRRTTFLTNKDSYFIYNLVTCFISCRFKLKYKH